MTDIDMVHPAPSSLRFGDPGFIDAYGAAWGDAEQLLSFFNVAIRYEDKASGVVLEGHGVMRRFMKVYLTFSPSCVVTFHQVIAGPKSFAADWNWTGTGDGELRLPDGTTPANGKAFDVPGVSICTIDEDGLISTHTDYWDAATLMRQLAS